MWRCGCALAEAVCEGVVAADDELDALTVAEAEGEDEVEGVDETVGVPLWELELDPLPDALAEEEEDTEDVAVPDEVPVLDAVPLADDVPLGVPLAVAAGDAVFEPVGV